MSSLIIDSPHRQGTVRRIVQSGITLFFWGVWGYLMLPLAASLMTLVGIELALVASVAPKEYLRFIFPILLFIGVVMLSMELWVRYNIFLYRRGNRRHPPDIVYRTALARHFGVSPRELADWHRSAQMTIRLTEQGKVYDVEVKTPVVGTPRSGKWRIVRSRNKNGVVCLNRNMPQTSGGKLSVDGQISPVSP